MVSFVNVKRSAAVTVGVSNAALSSSRIKALSAPASVVTRPNYALFDGIIGPVSTPMFTGGFQLFSAGWGVENGPPNNVTSASIEIAAAAYRPILFNLCATGKLVPRVRLLLYGSSSQTDVYTLNGVTIGSLEDASAGDRPPLKVFMNLVFRFRTNKFQSTSAPL